MHTINSEFNPAASPRSKTASFEEAYDALFATLGRIAKPIDNLDRAEPQIRLAFQDFLKRMNYPLAARNFEALLKEKSGDKFRRQDGSVNWYHEFIPILTFMAIVRLGKEKGGIDFVDLERHGGFGTWISSHLRHDSVEDHTSIRKLSAELNAMVGKIKAKDASYDTERAYFKNSHTLNNTNLMTQKVAIVKGEREKENVTNYTYRMVASKKASPIAFMSKQGDIIHNFSTLFGADKFGPAKRLKRCNDREDMYGPRYPFINMAKRKWPEFENGINILDGMMGSLLYPHFRYLQDVDLFYKQPSDIPVGIEHYLEQAFKITYPDDKFNPIHIGMKRMMSSLDHSEDQDKRKRLINFMKKVIRPALLDQREHFPYLFETSGHHHPHAPSPVAK